MDIGEFKPAEGNCIISEDVIASIACTAATEVSGVAGMASRPTDIKGFIAPSPALKSVKVQNGDNGTELDVYVNFKQGARIQETAAALQHSVKVAVQSMTGRPVTRVNVHVAGMALEEKMA